ncbi:MAG: ATP synthase F0 subunit B [Acidobacteriia bacterium]|nr:ATP synthase F0 subunit B [Terriglobia bacterium]
MPIFGGLRRSPVLALPLLLCVMLWTGPAVQAQSSSPAQAGSAAPEPQTHRAAGEPNTPQSREPAGEDEAAQFKHSPSVQLVARVTGLSLEHAYWLCVSLNFLVIAAAILWLSKKNLPGLFRSRTASIQKAMEEARKASQDANRRLAEIEARLARLDGEIGEMRGAADNEAVAEEARIKAAAAEDARKVVEMAEQEIVAAAKAARRELTAYAADLAVTLARKQIQVDPTTDQALVRSFAEQLSNGGRPKAGKEDS